VILAYVLGRYAIQGATVAGFPFSASIIATFSGVQLFALGIMGEYLAGVPFPDDGETCIRDPASCGSHRGWNGVSAATQTHAYSAQE